MALANAIVFHGAVPAARVIEVRTMPLPSRILSYGLAVVVEELVLRLACMTALVALFVVAAGRRSDLCYYLAIAVVAFVAYPLWSHRYFAGLQWSALTAARELALHFSATALWGWLYWRHGWLAAVTAHGAAHLTLEPLMGVLV